MRLIVLDTETTGLTPASGRIVEIAAVEMLDGKPISLYTSPLRMKLA